MADQAPTPQFGNETVDSLAAKIKAKYPDYQNVDNQELVSRLISAHPVYQTSLSSPELQRLGGGTPETLGQGAYQTVKQTLENVGGAILSPIEGMVRLGTGGMAAAQQMGEAAARRPEQLVPVVGPGLSLLRPEERTPEGIRRALTGMAGQTLATAAAMGAPEAASGIQADIAGRQAARLNMAADNVHDALTNALKPSRTNAKWEPAVRSATQSGDLAAAIQNAREVDPATGELTAQPLKVKTATDLYNAVNQRNTAFWREDVQPHLEMAGGGTVDKAAVLDSLQQMKKGISAEIQPKLYEAVAPEEKVYYADPTKPMTIAKAQERVSDLNERLNGFFKATPMSTSDVEAAAPKIAATLAERQALNQQINTAVENLTGADVSALKKRWSDMKVIENEALRAKIAEETARNPGLGKALSAYGPEMLAGGAALLGGSPTAAAAIGTHAVARGALRAVAGTFQPDIGTAVRILQKLPAAQRTQMTFPTAPLPSPAGGLPFVPGGVGQLPFEQPIAGAVSPMRLQPTFQSPAPVGLGTLLGPARFGQ